MAIKMLPYWEVRFDRADDMWHVFRSGEDMRAASENLDEARKEMDRLADEYRARGER